MAYWVLVGKQSWEDGGRDVDRPLLVVESEHRRDEVHDGIAVMLKTGGTVGGTFQRDLNMAEIPATVIESMLIDNAVRLAPKSFNGADAHFAPNWEIYGDNPDSDYTYDLMWYRVSATPMSFK